ncbi:MAG: hypothetical protein EXQ95_12905 [Alphaproteobacteria bacterium]|nr:hypothetical protein [Alphaproteobacteria bacterium]
MRETAAVAKKRLFVALGAGAAYFAIAFGSGFVLGTLRVLFVVPALGESVAVMLELPIMLAISWFASQWLVARFEVARSMAARLLMGGAAFGLLMSGEGGVSMFAFGRTLSDHIESYRSLAGILGILGQIAFGLFPALQLSIRR